MGTALIEKSLATEAGRNFSEFGLLSGLRIGERVPAEEGPVLALAHTCLAAAINDITSSEPDLADIKRRIELLVEDQPTLKIPAVDWMLEGLAESVAHDPPPPN